MKKIIFYSIIGLALVLCSCEDNFDPQIYGKLFSNNFPKTEADCESYLMTCYIPFNNTWTYNLAGNSQHNLYIPEGGFMRMFDSPSDHGLPWTVGNWGGGWLQLSQGNFANCINYNRASSGGSPSHFEKVRDITRITEVIGTFEGVDFLTTDAKKKSLIGEARLLRGLLMYNLLHIYGPVPVIVDPALIGNLEAEQNMVRPSLDEMAAYIYDDFDYAQQNMVNTATKGRYTADYAKYCLMRHCLNEGEHMPGYYDKAIDMYQALNTGKYSLFTTGADAYADQFKQANKFNVEVIMSLSVSASGDGSNSKGDFNPISWYVLSSDVSKYADAANTVPTPFVLQGGGWGQVYNVAPAYYDTYEPGDLRREVIITSYYQNNAARTLHTRADVGVGWSGFIINKYPIEINQQFQPTDVPLARWADVLLMYAEATARKNKAVPTGSAMDAVTAVRARAGLSALSGAATADYDGFMEALLAERGHELLYEGCRKIDLIRFNKYRHNCKAIKGLTPTHQYMPLPNFAVLQAETYGKTLVQTFERPGFAQDN